MVVFLLQKNIFYLKGSKYKKYLFVKTPRTKKFEFIFLHVKKMAKKIEFFS